MSAFSLIMLYMQAKSHNEMGAFTSEFLSLFKDKEEHERETKHKWKCHGAVGYP